MTWAIGDDEFPLLRGEKPIGDVDRDALLTLGCKSVYKQRKVDFLTLRAHPFGIGFQSRKLIFKNHLGIVQ